MAVSYDKLSAYHAEDRAPTAPVTFPRSAPEWVFSVGAFADARLSTAALAATRVGTCGDDGWDGYSNAGPDVYWPDFPPRA